jgi:hypothetical protein
VLFRPPLVGSLEFQHLERVVDFRMGPVVRRIPDGDAANEAVHRL